MSFEVSLKVQSTPLRVFLATYSVTCRQLQPDNIKQEVLRIKQFLSFKYCHLLGSMINYCTNPFCSSQVMSDSFTQSTHMAFATHLRATEAILVIRSAEEVSLALYSNSPILLNRGHKAQE